MSIFSRFADIINSNLNALLDKAEDPQKLIRMVIQEMEDTLVEVRTVSAKSLAEKKELSRKFESMQRQVLDWSAKAELALSKDREDLARAALIEKQKLTTQLEIEQKHLSELDKTLSALSSEIQQLQEKLSDARLRQQTIAQRFNAQNSRLKVKRKIFESESVSVVEKFERFERQIDKVTAETESFDLGNSGLKAQFDELESDEKINDELTAIREKLNSKGTKSKQKEA